MKYLRINRKIKNSILKLSYLIVLLFLSECNNNPVNNPESGLIIKKINTSPIDYTEYSYKGDLLIGKEIVTRGKTSYSINLIYDSVSRLIKQEEHSSDAGVPVDSYTSYEYSGSNLLEKTYFYVKTADSSYQLNTYTIYEYQNGKLTWYEFYNGQTGETVSYDSLIYDGNGNIIRHVRFDNGNNLILSETFEYDNKANPLGRDLSLLSVARLSKNNVTKNVFTYYNTNPPGFGSYLNSYNYNNEGYPVNCSSVYQISWKGVTSKDTVDYQYEYY